MDIQELVASVTLEDIWCIERVGKLDLDPDVGLANWTPEDPSGALELGVNPVSWGDRIEAWFRLKVEHPSAQLLATFAVIYRREDESPIPTDVRKDFLERVAVMACLPYLREAIQHIAIELRLGNVVLPIVKLGEIEIDLSEGAEGHTVST